MVATTPIAVWREVHARGFDQVDPAQADLARRVDAAIARSRATFAEPTQPQPPIPSKMPLWPHQLRAFWFAYRLGEAVPCSLQALGMGSGKSAVACALATNWGCRRVLILCPPSVRAVWRREIGRHVPGEQQTVILDAGGLRGRTAIANKAWETYSRSEAFRRNQEPLWLVINYEAAWRAPFAEWATSREWDCVILDESHIVKSAKAKCSLFAARLAAHSRYRLCLSGTPLAQTPMDAFGQARFLDLGLFGEDYKAFVERDEDASELRLRRKLNEANAAMARIVESMPEIAHLAEHCGVHLPDGWLDGIKNKEEYQERIGLITYHCRTEDVLPNLPTLRHEERFCALGPEARRIYAGLENELIAALDEDGEKVCGVGSHLAKLVRLQQCTSGWLPDTETGEMVQVDRSKCDALYELLLEAHPEPVVVFARYRQDLAAVRATVAALGMRYGEVSHAAKDGLTRMGEMAPDKDVVGVQPQSGSLGISLTRARIGVIYSPSFSLSQFDQSITRILRPGQKRPVTIYRLICEQTIDERIYAAIEARREVVRAVLEGLRVHSTRHAVCSTEIPQLAS